MDNFEIILKDFPKKNLDKFVDEELLKYKKMIRYSNFFDNKSNTNLTIEKILSLSGILDPIGSGIISFSALKFGVFLGSAVIMFSFDELVGDIEINFEEDSVFVGEKIEVVNRCEKIIKKALELKKKYSVPVVLMGFEPAEDEDTCLLKLDNDDINLAKAIKKLLPCEFRD